MNPFIAIFSKMGSSIIDKPVEIIGKQLDQYQNRQNMKLTQELKHEDAKFNQQLEMERAKMNAELDDMVARKEIERSELVMKKIQEYNNTIAECAVSIGKSIGMMSIEMREQAHSLILEKKQKYLDMQNDAQKRAMDKFESIAKRLPEGSRPREIMEESVGKELSMIIDVSGDFMRAIDEDFKNMLANIDDIVKGVTEGLKNNVAQVVPPSKATSGLLGKGN